MNKDMILKMSETNRLKLDLWKLFWHYFTVLAPLIPVIMTIFSIYQMEITGTYKGVRTKQELISTTWPFLIVSVIFLIIKYNRLFFKRFKTNLSPEQFKSIVKEAGNEMEWSFEKLTNNYAIAKTGFNFLSWGERITILRLENEILINSICDPDNRPSIASWGMNRKNVNSIKKRLKPVPNTS